MEAKNTEEDDMTDETNGRIMETNTTAGQRDEEWAMPAPGDTTDDVRGYRARMSDRGFGAVYFPAPSPQPSQDLSAVILQGLLWLAG